MSLSSGPVRIHLIDRLISQDSGETVYSQVFKYEINAWDLIKGQQGNFI